ncbi:MAG: hypothetical protein U1G07_08235 [Verrucomicrobiota bacterium]
MRWLSPCWIGLLLAVVYGAVAIYVIWEDRTYPSGGWINLNGLPSLLITFPVSSLCEFCGSKLDFRRNLDMALAVAGTGLAVYAVGAGMTWLLRILISAIAVKEIAPGP